MDRVYFDTETSGFTPGQIAQLSYIKEYDSGEIVAKNFFFYVNYIEEGAEAVTGRGKSFYTAHSNGLRFGDHIAEIEADFANSILIAHNIEFDEKFMSAEFWRLGKIFSPASKLCTMNYFKPICNIKTKANKVKNPKLVELIDYFGIDNEKISLYCEDLFNEPCGEFHDAMYDTTAMFIACKLHAEQRENGDAWKNTFCVK